jgi:hypothetical protein
MTEPFSFEDKLRAAARVPDPDPQFLAGLRARIAAQPVHSPSFGRKMKLFFLRPAVAGALFMLLAVTISLALIGPQKVLAAFQGLLGYIPGIGFVDESSDLRVLAEAVHVERDGITLDVEQGAVDSQHTVLIYQVNGLSIAAANSQGEGATTGSIAQLRLPDGSLLEQTGGEGPGWGTGYQLRLVFPALPRDIKEATLVIPRLVSMPAGAAPEGWQVQLHFKPAPPDMQVMPVFELNTPQVAATQQQTEVASPIGEEQLPVETTTATGDQPFQVVLDKVVELEDHYLFTGYLQWQREDIQMQGFSVALTDANGQELSVAYAPAEAASHNPQPGRFDWALQSAGKAIAGPLTLTVTSLSLVEDPGITFTFDPGPGPQLGQTWAVDQQLDLAGYNVQIVSAELMSDSRGLGLRFTMQADLQVNYVGLTDEGNALGHGGSGAVSGELTATIHYGEHLPRGPLTITATEVNYMLPVSLPLSIPLPGNETAVSDSGSLKNVAACLTQNSLQQLQAHSGDLPVGLGGRLLLEENTGQSMPQISLSTLDGSQQQPVAIGGWSALSPDGSTVAYITSDGPGLYLFHADSGESHLLSGTTPGDYHPVWSPDGQQIAFVRTNNGIYVVGRDGSGLRQVVDASTLSFLVGWLPDGQHLVITSLGQEGSMLQVVDVVTGQRQDQFVIGNRKGGFAQLSPDGSRLAYSQQVFGEPYYGVYVASLDGSGEKLVASLNGAVAGSWSPDGHWLSVSVSQPDGKAEIQVPLFIQVDTCQVVLADGLRGDIASWVESAP